MKVLILPIIVAASVYVPLAARADEIVTLTYQSAPLTGSYTYLPTGFTSPTEYPSLPTAPFAGVVNGSITFDDTTLSENGHGVPMSYYFDLTGTGGTNVYLSPSTPVFLSTASTVPCSYAPLGACIGILSDNGTVTGATVGFDQYAYGGPYSTLSIQPGGDFATFTGPYDAVGPCPTLVENVSPGVFTYSGKTISPCTVQSANSAPGQWTVSSTSLSSSAPEIDPASAISAFTLLSGGLAVIRARRSRKKRD
jgi:hypothetical protein